METGNHNLVMNGTIIKELPTYFGKTRDGKDMEKRTYIMETTENKPEKLKFDMLSFDGPCKQLEIGQQIKVEFKTRTTEYNGNYYTNLTALRIYEPDF